MTVKTTKPVFPAEAASQEYAASLDAAEPLTKMREEFIIPSKANLASKKLAKPGMRSPLYFVLLSSLNLTHSNQVSPQSPASTSAATR